MVLPASTTTLDAIGPEQIRAAFTAAVTTTEQQAEDAAGIAGVLTDAADRYEQRHMAPSTVEHLRAAAGALTGVQTHLDDAAQALHAAGADFDAHDGQVADTIAATGNLAGHDVLTGDTATSSCMPAPSGESTAATTEQDTAIDVGPGALYPYGWDGPGVEWFDANTTGGRVMRVTDVDRGEFAAVDLSPERIRALRDELGRSLADGDGGRLDAGNTAMTWQLGPDGRYHLQVHGDDDKQMTLAMTPAQMRAWHTQLDDDLTAEDTARADFDGVTGRLADKPRGQTYDVDAPLRLPAGVLTGEQLAASARALRLYRNGSWRPVAAHLRGDADPDETFLVRELPGEQGQTERVADHVAAIDQALAAAPLAAPITVWRGQRELGECTGVDLHGDPVGTTWTEPSFPSTSIDPDVARIFSDYEVLLRLHVPAGMGAVQLDSRPTTREHTREAEVLLPRGLTMRVVGESEVPIGGGGVTFRDGQKHVAPPTAYRVLEVEVSMPTPPERPSTEGNDAQPTVTAPEPLPRSSEPIRPPNGAWGIDQGLMHFDGALGKLWNGLGDERHLQVDGHALGNVITDLGEGITRRHHDTNHALRELRRIRTQLPDSSTAAQHVDTAINRLDAPDRPAPALPDNAPQQLKNLMAELNAIALVRRGYDVGSSESSPFHETDQLAEIAGRWLNGEISRGAFEREIGYLTHRRHESSEGWTEIREAVSRALRDFRQWAKRPT